MAKRSKRNKTVKGRPDTDSGKQVRQSADAGRADHLTIAWRLSRFDWDGPWGTGAFEGQTFEEVIQGWCCEFERQTWAEAFRAGGGRRRGNNNHPVRSENLTKQAKDRLNELNLEEYDTLYSFRLTSTLRVYGIRDSRAFEALWFDPWHGDNEKAVYPTQKR